MTIDQAIENLQKIREKLTPHCKTTVFVQVVIDLNEQIEAKEDKEKVHSSYWSTRSCQ